MQKKGMELEGLVKSGDVVLAGVSGGADSTDSTVCARRAGLRRASR